MAGQGKLSPERKAFIDSLIGNYDDMTDLEILRPHEARMYIQ